jgi:hypothetical protein
VTVLVSRHRDGEAIARVISKMGFDTVRGSTTRGGALALIELVGLSLSGNEVAITPDGPRGPRHQAKEGILYLAQKSGLPIQPIAVGFSDFWELRSWDRFRIPKPFACGYAMWGEAMCLPQQAELGGAQWVAALKRLETSLNGLERAADEKARQLGHNRRRG